eukprot:TRINITY_DN307460_c0_g1_i1.p1 TRINITY_DN307460_c0_g1~~TRINITY_DN307460_c0_g1_i1.p1  ORF type:complete len:159 (+),score=32.45 TRINITY_DN307460_c0_g1_i1:61-537(+)
MSLQSVLLKLVQKVKVELSKPNPTKLFLKPKHKTQTTEEDRDYYVERLAKKKPIGTKTWVGAQKKRNDDTFDVLEHLLKILHDEMEKETKREVALLSCDERELPRVSARVFQDRAEAADWIMRIMQDYSIISATEAFDYLHGTVSNDAHILKPNELWS